MGVYPSDATLEMQNMTKPGSTLAAGFNPRCSLTSRRVFQTRVCGSVRSVEVESLAGDSSGAVAGQSSPVRVLGVVSRHVERQRKTRRAVHISVVQVWYLLRLPRVELKEVGKRGRTWLLRG